MKLRANIQRILVLTLGTDPSSIRLALAGNMATVINHSNGYIDPAVLQADLLASSNPTTYGNSTSSETGPFTLAIIGGDDGILPFDIGDVYVLAGDSRLASNGSSVIDLNANTPDLGEMDFPFIAPAGAKGFTIGTPAILPNGQVETQQAFVYSGQRVCIPTLSPLASVLDGKQTVALRPAWNRYASAFNVGRAPKLSRQLTSAEVTGLITDLGTYNKITVLESQNISFDFEIDTTLANQGLLNNKPFYLMAVQAADDMDFLSDYNPMGNTNPINMGAHAQGVRLDAVTPGNDLTSNYSDSKQILIDGNPVATLVYQTVLQVSANTNQPYYL